MILRILERAMGFEPTTLTLARLVLWLSQRFPELLLGLELAYSQWFSIAMRRPSFREIT